MDTNDVLANCTVKGNIVTLPQVNLDRNQYVQVKKKFENIGGKWKGGKVSGFVFDKTSSPTELIKRILKGENVNLKKEFQFFATPLVLANKLVEYADLKPEDTVLEPSAGQGSIIEAICKDTVITPDCFELMEENRSILEELRLHHSVQFRFNIIGEDFLKSDNKTYSKIIANPPFSKNQDITHVYKMYDKLDRGGRLVSIMSNHWRKSKNKKESEFRSWLNAKGVQLIELGINEFKESGTAVSSVILILNKD